MLLHLAFLFWMILDPFGAVPIFVSHVGFLPPKRQFYVIFREMVIALLIMIFVLFFGREFFNLLGVDEHVLSITGGMILFLIGIKMIFAQHDSGEPVNKRFEPLITPLAMPIMAGPGILTAILLYSGDEVSNWVVLGAILIAWGCSLPIMLLGPQIKKYIGPNGAVALERLFGFIVIVISIQMFLGGLAQVIHT